MYHIDDKTKIIFRNVLRSFRSEQLKNFLVYYDIHPQSINLSKDAWYAAD